jgi:tetratricopeptide (TPR) repeat protein
MAGTANKQFSGSRIAMGISLTLAFSSVAPNAFAQSNANSANGQRPIAIAANQTISAEELRQARANAEANPTDAKAHYTLAELLRKSGRNKEAAHEYLETTQIDPAYNLAYHQLSIIGADPAQLETAVTRLKTLKQEKPNDLMLRVALSEIQEKQGEFYQAARELIDLIFQNSVPDKYKAKVNARIHYLLSKAKYDEINAKGITSEDELDVVPPPLPESVARANEAKNLAASKNKDAHAGRGAGHTPLLP